jgi:hypothetical protein
MTCTMVSYITITRVKKRWVTKKKEVQSRDVSPPFIQGREREIK